MINHVRTSKKLGRALTFTALLAAVLASPGTASAAGNAGISGGVLTYTGGSENNSVTLSISGSQYTFTDFNADPVSAGSGCTTSNGPAGPLPIINCSRSGVTAIVIRANDGNDVAQVSLGQVVPPGVTLTVELGAGDDSWAGHNGVDTVLGGTGNDSIDVRDGDDVVHGGGGRDTVTGGNGDDQLFGDAGTDHLSGNEGDDAIDGGDGTDEVRGGPGNDNVRGGAGNDTVGGGLGADRVRGDAGNDLLFDDDRPLQITPFRSPDVLVGGTGVDTADYSYRLSEATPLRLSLDRVANDGATGEGDNIGPDGSIENIEGGIKADTITGSAAANRLRGWEGNDVINGLGGNDNINGSSNNDTIDGGTGTDTIEGGFGNDTVKGGAGRDAIAGGADSDVIKARDGVAESVNCGFGIDRAEVDRGDSVGTLCETIIR